MKRNLFLSAILPFSLAVALCACGSTPGESTPSEKTQSSVSQAQTDSAATGNEISIGNNFSIEAGTVLSDGSIYFVGREGADGFCAYVSTDDGDSWTKEELPWADQTVVGIKLRPDGFMLGMQGQQVVYAARGEDLKTADISALGAIEAWNAIEQPLVFLKSQNLWPMSLFLANITQDDIGIAMVASVFMLLPVILIFLFGQRYLILGIQSSGVKE